jgi:hypothetical protein
MYNIVTDLINALLGNSSVNTNRESAFSMRSAPSKSTERYRKSVARQRSSKHESTTMGDGVFLVVRAKELS